jgi:hypothetical protein
MSTAITHSVVLQNYAKDVQRICGLSQATSSLAQPATNANLITGATIKKCGQSMRVVNQRRWNRTKKFMIFILVLAALGMVGGLNESMDVEISADRYGFAYLFMGCAAYLVFTIIRNPD